MTIRRQHLADTDGRKRAIIEHNPLTREVQIGILGPHGGVQGTIRLEDDQAADVFREIIGSVMGIAQRREDTKGDLDGTD